MPTNKQHTIVFTEADLVILDKALTSLPYKEVVELIQRINHQLNPPQIEPVPQEIK